MSDNAPTVGYLPKGFPRISETFITNEILELERLGLNIEIYSLKRPVGAGRQPMAERVQAPLEYLPEKIVLSLPLLLPVHLLLFLQRPRQYWKCLRWTLARCRRSRSTSTLRRFFQAGYLVGWHLRGRQLPHYHAHFCHGPATVAMFVKWLTGASYSFTAHAKDLYLTDPEILREKMSHASFALTCTGFNLRYMEEVGQGACPTHLVYHGIDIERFTRGNTSQVVPMRSRNAAGDHVPMILSVGRLVEKKGFDTLIRAYALMRDQGLRFRAVIFGDGEKRTELMELIDELDLEGVVELPGAILQDELVEVYRQSDLFALACQILDNGDRDGLPNVLVEAASMEVPIVATDVSGVPELVDDGVNGFLVPARDPRALAERMSRLLNDAALRSRFAQAGRDRVLRDFDLQSNTRRILGLFQEVMGLSPVGTGRNDSVQPRETSLQ
jgi:glycosyltransferase involved in cell wall biosynthesis